MALFNAPGTLALELSPDASPEIRTQFAGLETISVLGGTSDGLILFAPRL
jgi:hypothetical protein